MRRIFRRLLCAAMLLLPLLSAPAARATQEPVHILLIGHDLQPGGTSSRSDCILLCSYLPQKGELVMTSFLRDLYVPIPGHGSNRLNAAYALGGRELLKSTLAQNFGVEVEGCVEVDFSQFAKIIDSLGGAELELRADEAAHINQHCGCALTQGKQTLTGEQALCYTRIRKLDPDGDFSRTRRQRELLKALLSKLRGADAFTLADTARRLLPLVKTDLDPTRILHWVFTMAPEMKELRVSDLRVPFPGTFREETVSHMAVLVPDLAANRAKLRDILK